MDATPPIRRDLIVIGASAGGVETLRSVVRTLPADLPASILIVLHISPRSPSALAKILTRSGALPCQTASDAQPLRHGEMYVAPPDHHLIVRDGHAGLTVGPRENGHRPAIDALFRSAALTGGARVTGVILSGTRDDGAAGLAMIRDNGGAVVVQDPDDALYGDMPRNALLHVDPDLIVPSTAIGAAVARLAYGEPLGMDARIATTSPAASARRGDLIMICPECGGVLSERSEAGMTHWECHVGHRYSPDTLLDAQGTAVEAAMWTAIRALSDRSRLLHRIASQAEAAERSTAASHFHEQALQAEEQAEVVREALRGAATGTLRSRIPPHGRVEDDDDVSVEG